MTDRTLHLHIGLPKTASTWLQDEVYPRLEHLTVRSVPRSTLFKMRDDAEQGFRVFACALRRSAAVWCSLGDAIFTELLGERRAWQARGSDLLISEEAVGRAASRPEALTEHLRAMMRAARPWGFARLRLIAVVRRQDRWLASHYAQVSDRNLRAGQADFEAMVTRTEDPARGRYGFGMLLDYGALHAALDQAADPADILTLALEQFEEEPGAALATLLGWLATPEPQVGPLVAEAVRRRVNVRSSTADHVARWRLRPPSAAGPGGRRWHVPGWAWPRRGIVVRPEMSKRILATYHDANRALADATGLDLQRYGYF